MMPTLPLPAQRPVPEARPIPPRFTVKSKRPHSWLVTAVGLAMCLSGVVLVEPAPIDAAIMGLCGLAVLIGQLSFAGAHSLPAFLLVLFLFANVVSMADPIEKTRTIWYALVTAYLGASLFFFAGLLTRHGMPAVRVLMRGYAFAAIYSVALGLGGYFNLLPGRDILTLYNRPKGLFKDPNVFGPFLIPVAIYALMALQVAQKRWAKVAWAATFLVCTLGVFLSFSRACWLNFAVSLGIYALMFFWSSESGAQLSARLVAAATFGCVAGILVLALVSVPAVKSMLMIRLGAKGLQSYDTKRFQVHDEALESARRRPLGIGPGQSEIAFAYATHSTYLRVLTENGVVGALAFYALLGASLWRALRLARTARTKRWRSLGAVLLACIGGVLANSVVIDSIHWRHLWLLLGMSWAAHPNALPLPTPSFRYRTPRRAPIPQ
ncbi:MAG: O-antigen ligase family protein [Bryobacterales bacterium]|nr:O-antigen ligase family protein [Bryobacterales bacterium]